MLSAAAIGALRLIGGDEERCTYLQVDFLAFIASLSAFDRNASPSAATLAFYCLWRIEQQEKRIAKLEEALEKRRLS